MMAKDDEDIEMTEEDKNFIADYQQQEMQLDELLDKRKFEDISSLKAQQILQKIPQEDYPLYFVDSKVSCPQDLIVTHILVPPVCIRPTVPVSLGMTNEDDLTIKIMEMIQLNQLIEQSILNGTEQVKINEQWYLLQSAFTQYLNSSTPGLPLNLLGSKTIRSLCQRLKGKHGRFRGNLSGKRVDFTGRTVISPDPNIQIDQVVVPIFMAKILTFPEEVNKINIEKLRKLVINGPEKYPGANYYVMKKNNSKINLLYGYRRKIAQDLQYGDIVERHLMDDDVVLFNRQPSLHRLSIMAHRVKVMAWKTLRFNECVCTPYNADFDGDEMNIHVPQTLEAKAEALQLMRVQENLITPKNGEPIVALTQDFLTSAFLISSKDVFYDRAQFCKICSYFNDASEWIELPHPTIIKPLELWTGKQLISCLLRPNRHSKLVVNIELKEKNYGGKNKHMDGADGWVCFYNSELISGRPGKSTLGSGGKSGLFYAIIRDNSNYLAAQIMSRFSKFSARWISEFGMSISAYDVAPSVELIVQKQEKMEQAYENCDEQIQQFQQGTLINKAGCNAEQTLESNMNGILSKIRDECGSICIKQLPSNNPALIMFLCGSKGSSINLSQMIACVGQQTVSGQRVPNGFTNRSLPHFERNSKHPAAKGFVKNSFWSGMNATEFFFHTMGGREGLIDTAVKTAETGYMQRRLMKALEDLCVNYDYSVRTSTGDIVQFLYGEDALEPMKLEENSQPVNFNRLFKYCQTIYPYKRSLENSLLPWQIAEIFDQKLNKVEIIDKSLVTVQFQQDIRQYFESLMQEIATLRKSLGLCPYLQKDDEQNFLFDENIIDQDGSQNLVDSIRCITMRQIDLFFKKLWMKYSNAMIVPGEAVGAVTAQSIGEPGTQMTLKTFHFAGVASMNITLGVPRIKEIINASKTISTPIITANLINNKDPVIARIIKGNLEKTLLGDICTYIKEVYSSSGCYLVIKLSLQTIESLKLDINILDVKQAILKAPKIKLKDDHIKILNPLKLRVDPSDFSGDGLFFSIQIIKRRLPDIIIKGITTINRTVIQKSEKNDGTENYFLLVEGYGLNKVMTTSGIDGTKTTSNHIMEVEQYLGIEAGRQCISNEISNVMEAHGITVDIRHLRLLAEIMTFKGQILGITRFGISKMKDSTLMLASFEKTTDILFDASLYNKKDTLNGVSECIILGKTAPIGTGIFEIIWDMDKHSKSKQTDLTHNYQPLFSQ